MFSLRLINRLNLVPFTLKTNINFLKSTSSASFCTMTEPTSETTEEVFKLKYDGRTKKRKWENRRSDGGAALDAKREKVDEVFERIKRRKYALLLGYSGVNFYGMQRNPNTPTIEENLLKALFEINYISEENFNQVQSMQFQRAARTDKGVSAARQIVSLKLPETIEIDKINEKLPEVIRVFGARRVTKGFNSKSQCDARTYTYMLPTVAFAGYTEDVKQETYKLSDEKLTEINNLLGKFVGAKNFHNYTSKKRHNDPSAIRYMMSFICEKPFVYNGVEFAVLKVKGQSFMLHQIRKMVGITLAVIRGHTNLETFEKTFTSEKVNVPKAPGLGLVLDFVHYTRYGFRYKDHDSLLWEEENEVVQAFKEKHIYPTIVDTEIKENSMESWLTVLLEHGYECKEGEENNEKEEKIGSVSD